MDKGCCYEVYYIKEAAFKLLLAGLGQKEWYGLFSESEGPGQGNWKQEAVNSVLADMYQEGMVEWDGAGITVRQPYADMFSAMLEKRICITVKAQDESSPIRCCYVSETSVVMTQKSQREDRTIGMAHLPVQGWIRLLEEECVRLENGECCQLACRSSDKGTVYQSIRICKSGLRTFCMEWAAGGGGHLCCTQEEFESKLKAVLYMGQPVHEKEGGRL